MDNSQVQNSSTQLEPKKRKSVWLWILIGLIFLGVVFFGVYILYQRFFQNSTTNIEEQKIGELKVTEPKLDTENTTTKILGANGGVIFTHSSDGTLYSLTIPVDALVLDTEISLTPLKSSSVQNYPVKKIYGVRVEPDDNFLSKAVYLSIEPNTEIPELVNGAAEWGRCNTASRGFDPEICAAEQKIPFGLGVNPGKVVIFSHPDYGILLKPTIPIEDENVFAAQIWRGGNYLADSANLNKIKALLKATYENSPEFGDEMEILSQYAGLGGDLNTYKDKIQDIDRSSSSFPRDIFKGVILALAIKDKAVAKEKIQEFNEIYSQEFDYIRGSFLPWPSYWATLIQIEEQFKKSENRTSWLWQKVQAKSKKKNTPKGNKIWEDFAKEQEEWLRQQMEIAKKQEEAQRKARETLAKDELSAMEKVDAIKTIVASGKYDATDKEFFVVILSDGIKETPSIGELEQIGKLGKAIGKPQIFTQASQKIAEIRSKSQAQDCDLINKNLGNFGQNSCKKNQ